MKTHTQETSDIAISAQGRIDDLKEHVLFRLSVFALSAAGGYLFSRLAQVAARLVLSLGAGAHSDASPFMNVVRALCSGLGR
jgi:hypothetical protein